MLIIEPAPPTPAAARILRAAGDLFYEHGIGAVGVDRIAEVAGTTKKTLYDRFGSKEQLVVEYLRRRHARFTEHVHAHLNAAPPDAETSLVVFEALTQWLAMNPRGCGFVNAYAELAGTNHAGLAVIGDEKRWVQELFVTLLRSDLPVAPPSVVAQTARTFALLYEGALVRATAGEDAQAGRLAGATARRLLAMARSATDQAVPRG